MVAKTAAEARHEAMMDELSPRTLSFTVHLDYHGLGPEEWPVQRAQQQLIAALNAARLPYSPDFVEVQDVKWSH